MASLRSLAKKSDPTLENKTLRSLSTLENLSTMDFLVFPGFPTAQGHGNLP
jgi:hypothetical protein